MKKILLFASALAGMFLAGSCQRENLEPVQQGNTVSYTVQVPGAISTKTIGENVETVTELVYEVYRTEATSKDDHTQAEAKLFHKTATITNGTATVEFELVNDQNFRVLFWAQVPGNGVYTVDNLKNVTISQALNANAENYAAFAGTDYIEAGESIVGRTITLRRPIAQLNIGTDDESLWIENQTKVVISTTAVTVNGLSTSFNVAENKAGEISVADYVYEAMPVALSEGTFAVNGTDYNYVAMNYVGFAPHVGANIDVTYTINTENVGTIENTIVNVPVKPNYRTNIIGNLITSMSDYTITLDEEWKDLDGGNMEVIIEGLVKNINGDYEVSTAKGLAYAINNLFVDANGVANTATFYVKPGIYDMAQQALNDITVTSGTLKIYDTEAVVTRSVTIGGVVITGLSKPLIQTVKEDATVFFSGITVQDFEGEDQDAALVQNNEGKVVLADCAIVDENGNVDEETDLVGGNAPVEVEKGEEEAGDLIYTAAQLADAFANEAAESIVLGADITLENTLVFPEGRTATLDLRGWKLMTAENMPLTNPLVAVNGDLTITDSYGIGGITASKTSAIQANHGGKLTINCNVTAHEATVRAVGGEAIISGGKYVQTGTYYSNPSTLRYTIDCRPDDEGNVGKLTIAGGEFVSNNGVINAGGEITINGGTFNNDMSEVAATRHMMYVNGSAVVNIKGGEFFAKANAGAGGEHICVYTSGATVKIAGGKFTSLKGNGSANSIISEYSAGSAISVTGGEFNTDLGLTKYIHKDYKAVKNAETAMWDVVEKVYVAKIGEDGYESLQEAVAAAQDGETITLVADETFTETNRYNNGGYWDGLAYSGDKSFTIDLGGYTIKQDGSLNDYLMWVKNDGAKANTITLKNGTMDAGTTAYSAFATASSNKQTITVNLENINLINNISNGAVVKARGGSVLNVKAGTVITGKDSYVGIEAVGNNTVVNVYEGAEIYQNGTSSYVGAIIGASYNATLNIYGGKGKSAKCGIIVMSTGATINVSGGEWTANGDGTVAGGNQGVLVSQNNRNESGWACKSIFNVTGGTFKGGYDCWGMGPGQEPDDAQINIMGGNFNANPEGYLVKGYEATEVEGGWNVDLKTVKTWEEFTASLAADYPEIKLGADITYDANYQLQKSVIIDLNEYSMTLPMINIHTKTTIKNGTINGKVYARKNSEVVFDGVTFSGAVADNLSTEGHLAIQGGCKSLYAKNCLFSPTSVSGSQTKPLSFEGGNTQIKFENCEFKNSPYKKQVYLNSLSATGSLEFIGCNFNNKTPNIMFAATCPLTNITMSGTTKLSSVTFEINRAKDAVTEAEWAHISSLIANNSFGSVRVFYAGGSSEYIR